jgi:site-specific DNA-methyltransferase (adenine-specific)
MIAMLSEPGDVVLDPFSGRGTTLLEARLMSRLPLAVDVNPIAVALSRAKNTSVNLADVKGRIEELRDGYDRLLYLPEAQVQKDDIQLIFHPATLAQLCYLRRILVRSNRAVDQFLVGALLGVMHGAERMDGSSGYASISMPNTFSMSPNYVRKFVATNRLNRIPRDVFQLLEDKADRLFREPAPSGSEGLVLACDAKQLKNAAVLQPYVGKVRLVVTSPPYLGVVNYAKQNWIRSWLLEDNPESALTKDLDDDLTLGGWLDFVEEIALQLKAMMQPGGVVVMVIGDVANARRGNYISLAREFMLRVRHDAVFRYVGCFEDHIAQDIKTTRIWKDTKGRATDIDRLIVLSDDVPDFRTTELPGALGLPEMTAGELKHISAKALATNAEVFSSLAADRVSVAKKKSAKRRSTS